MGRQAGKRHKARGCHADMQYPTGCKLVVERRGEGEGGGRGWGDGVEEGREKAGGKGTGYRRGERRGRGRRGEGTEGTGGRGTRSEVGGRGRDRGVTSSRASGTRGETAADRWSRQARWVSPCLRKIGNGKPGYYFPFILLHFLCCLLTNVILRFIMS